MLKKARSVLDIFNIGVGPSEVYTLGPWHAAQRFLHSLEEKNEIQCVSGLKILLYGPVAKNCKSCRTDHAIILGLSGFSPLSFDSGRIEAKMNDIRKKGQLFLHGMFDVPFDPDIDIVCLENETLPFHQNALTFIAGVIDGQIAETYYLAGDGSIIIEGEAAVEALDITLPFPIHDTADLIRSCEHTGKKVSGLVFENEKIVVPLFDDQDIGKKHLDGHAGMYIPRMYNGKSRHR